MEKMRREHFIADLEMIIERIDSLREGLLAEAREHGDKFSDREEGKWEGAFVAIRGLLLDELGPCLNTWKNGEPFSRKSEDMLKKEELRRAGLLE